jgi:hypothetical protein
MVFLLKRSTTNSVKEYYKLLFVETPKERALEAATQIELKEIKVLYEKFCFLKHFSELPLTSEENKKFLKKKGFDLIEKEDLSTNYYTHIKFKEKRDVDNLQIAEEPDFLNVSTLEYFVRHNCDQTQFEQDIVSTTEFKER